MWILNKLLLTQNLSNFVDFKDRNFSYLPDQVYYEAD